MSAIAVAGDSVYFRHHRGEGTAPPLVLVHGAGGSHMHWPGELRRLPGHEVYAVDLPGHGKSGGRCRSSIVDYAEVIRGFVDALRLPALVLGGHSMGGAITLEFALRYPGRLAGVILVGTGARLRVSPQILDGLLTDYDGTTALLTAWAHRTGTPSRELNEYKRQLRKVPAAVIRDDYIACDAFDRRADVGQIQAPALIICGTDDRLTPPRFSEWLAKEVPHAELVLVQGAGHMIMLEPGREVAVQAVASFLRRLAQPQPENA